LRRITLNDFDLDTNMQGWGPARFLLGRRPHAIRSGRPSVARWFGGDACP